MLDRFIGRQVVFGVSEPWDFSTEHGVGPFPALVKAASQDALLLELPALISYKGVRFDYLVATPRHVDKDLSQATDMVAIPANLTPVPAETIKGNEPLEFFKAATAWRQWHLVGGLQMAKSVPGSEGENPGK